MNLLVNLLKAFGIALGTCVLFVHAWSWTLCIAMVLNPSTAKPYLMAPAYWSDPAVVLGFFASLFVLAFSALHLPPLGRVLTAAVTISLLFGWLLWQGISLYMTHFPR